MNCRRVLTPLPREVRTGVAAAEAEAEVALAAECPPAAAVASVAAGVWNAAAEVVLWLLLAMVENRRAELTEVAACPCACAVAFGVWKLPPLVCAAKEVGE